MGIEQILEKQTLLDFRFSLFQNLKKKKKKVDKNEKEVMSVENDSQKAEDFSLGASVSVPPV